MKQVYFWLLLVALLLLLSSNLSSQGRFKAGVVGGINLSQIDGDNYAGYNKFGLTGGLRASTIITEKIQLDFEILFSQRGCVSDKFTGFNTTPHYFNIRLNYAEIPILFTYKWKKVKSKKSKKEKYAYYKYSFSGGASVGRVIRTKIEERLDLSFIDVQTQNKITSWVLIEDKIIKSDVTGTFGFSYYFNKNTGLLIRSSTSLTPLYRPSKNDNYGKVMRNYYLTMMGFYQF